jgi:hypothetical protein
VKFLVVVLLCFFESKTGALSFIKMRKTEITT